MVATENRLSIFVDESGDFGFRGDHSRWYIFSMVFHSQEDDLSVPMETLEQKMKTLGFPEHCLHAGPIIRRELDYKELELPVRRGLFFAMRQFMRSAPVKVKTFIFDKKEWNTRTKLQARIAQELGQFLNDNLAYFQSYNSIALYYDNGQSELGTVLNTVCNAVITVETKREVKPSQYRLFQLADYVCTLELVAHKATRSELSNSESRFFKSKELEKMFMREVRKIYL